MLLNVRRYSGSAPPSKSLYSKFSHLRQFSHLTESAKKCNLKFECFPLNNFSHSSNFHSSTQWVTRTFTCKSSPGIQNTQCLAASCRPTSVYSIWLPTLEYHVFSLYSSFSLLTKHILALLST